jgi:uncharacterized protein
VTFLEVIDDPRIMHIVPFYAAILALLYVALSIRTLRLRRRLKIAIGDAGNPAMLRAMRVHSNFAEYVPLSLLLLFFVEGSGAHPILVHVFGLALLAGRISHAFGVSRTRENYAYRVFGMATTLTTIICASLYLLYAFAREGIA